MFHLFHSPFFRVSFVFLSCFSRLSFVFHSSFFRVSVVFLSCFIRLSFVFHSFHWFHSCFIRAISVIPNGMGVATDRATRSMLPRAYAQDNAADLRGRIFITSTTTRSPSSSCGVSLALDLRRSPLPACHCCSST